MLDPLRHESMDVERGRNDYTRADADRIAQGMNPNQ